MIIESMHNLNLHIALPYYFNGEKYELISIALGNGKVFNYSASYLYEFRKV
jgi:hypothetical protein